MDAGVCKGFMFVCDAVLFLEFALRAVAVSLGPLQVLYRMPLICTTVQQRHGRRLGSAWRALTLQLHLLGTWPSSREVTRAACWYGLWGSWGTEGCVCMCMCFMFVCGAVLLLVFALRALAVS